MANKIIEGAEQMVEAFWCDHELTMLPPLSESAQPSKFDRMACAKCKVTLFIPKKPLHS
jgi:hypothetical protein